MISSLASRNFALPSASANPIKTVYAMVGIPGAGKSTFLKHAFSFGLFPEEAFILDPDGTMVGLDGYQDHYDLHGADSAFQAYELPARKLAYQGLETACHQQRSIVIDMGCAREENFDMLQSLKAQGYALHLHYIFCPPEEAIKRALERDRFTPETMIYERYENLVSLIPKYMSLADRFVAFDNSDLSTPFQTADIFGYEYF